MEIEWRPLVKAIVISIIAGLILGAVWGLIGFTAYVSSPESTTKFYESVFVTIVGFLLGLIPIAAGSWYLARAVRRHLYKHAVLFGGLHVLMTGLFIAFFPILPSSTSDLLYCLAVVPTALATCRATPKSNHMQTK